MTIVHNSIDAVQARLKAADSYAKRNRVLACKTELQLAASELARAITRCDQAITTAEAESKQLDMFRVAGAI